MWEKIKIAFRREVVVVEQPITQPSVDIGLDDDSSLFCENCKTPIKGGFCSGCGQKNTSLSRPIWFLISDMTEDIVSRDSKLFRTIWQIIFWPGSLTRDFMDGKRARFIPPIRFYLLSTLLFFITLAIADVAILKFEFREADPNLQAQVQVVNVNPEGPVGFEANMFMPAEPSADARVLLDDYFDDEKADIQKQLDKADNSAVEIFVLERSLKSLDGLIHVSKDPRRLNSTLNDWVSRSMIILLPLFALLLRIFYWKRENCLMKQLVFSLHFHSAIFLMMTFLVIAQVVWGSGVSATMFYAAVPLYLFIAMKVANRQGIIKTTFKFFLVSLFYLITLSITVGLALMLSLSEV